MDKNAKAEKQGCSVMHYIKCVLSEVWQGLFPKSGKQAKPKVYKMPKKVLPGMYVYTDGLIYPEIIPDRQIKAVVGYVDDDLIYAICLQETELPWSNDFISDPHIYCLENGKAATRKILDAVRYAIARVHFQNLGMKQTANEDVCHAEAAEWCDAYNYDGVRKGEAFLPSIYEWGMVFPCYTVINASLKALGAAKLDGGYWTSNERNSGEAKYFMMFAPLDKLLQDIKRDESWWKFGGYKNYTSYTSKHFPHPVRAMLKFRL